MSHQTDNAAGLRILIAIFMGIAALITFFPSLATVGCGGFLGNLGAFSGSGSVNAAGGAVTLIGVGGLGISVGMVIYAFGLLTEKPWAYMGSIILNGLFLGLQLLTIVMIGFGTVQLIFLVLSGGCIFLLLTNENIKNTFGR